MQKRDDKMKTKTNTKKKTGTSWTMTNLLKKGIIRPHTNRPIKQGGKIYYYSEMTTGAGTHSGPLVPKTLVEKLIKEGCL